MVWGDFLGYVFPDVVICIHVMGGAAFKHNWPGTVFPKDMVVSGQSPKPLEIADFH